MVSILLNSVFIHAGLARRGSLCTLIIHGSVYSYIQYSFSLLIGTVLLVCGKYHLQG